MTRKQKIEDLLATIFIVGLPGFAFAAAWF